jgi:hypothetical protein
LVVFNFQEEKIQRIILWRNIVKVKILVKNPGRTFLTHGQHTGKSNTDFASYFQLFKKKMLKVQTDQNI